MRQEKLLPLACILAGLALSACKTTPEPVEVVEIEPPVLKTCTEISALTRVIIPEETEIYYAITEIENPPYEPIQRKEKLTRVVKEAETIFVDSQGKQVTDICDTVIDPNSVSSVGQTPVF